MSPPYRRGLRRAWLSLGSLLLCSAALAANTLTGMTQRVSVGMGGAPPVRGTRAGAPALSADGRFLVFLSNAQSFARVSPDTVNVWVKDVATGELELVSQSTSGDPADDDSFAAAISGDGRSVVFISSATNLGGVTTPQATRAYVRDRVSRTTTPLALDDPPGGGSLRASPAITPDGRYVALETGGQVYVRDRTAGTWDLV